MARERHDTGLVCAVGVNKRRKEVRTVVILREYIVKFAVPHHIVEISVLCDVPAARAVDVDLLKERKVGRKVLDERDLAAGRISRGFQKIAACMRGSPSCKRSVHHYKDWGLLSLPITPAHRRKPADPDQ